MLPPTRQALAVAASLSSSISRLTARVSRREAGEGPGRLQGQQQGVAGGDGSSDIAGSGGGGEEIYCIGDVVAIRHDEARGIIVGEWRLARPHASQLWGTLAPVHARAL